MNDQRRHQLHWSAWLLSAIVGITIVWTQVVGYRRARHFGPQGNGLALYHAGWPMVYAERLYAKDSHRASNSQLSPQWGARLGFDVLCSLTGVAAVAFATQRILRSKLRFRISTLLVATATVCALLVVVDAQQVLLTPAEDWGFYWSVRPHLWRHYPADNWPKIAATGLALGCTFYSAFSLGAIGIGQLLRRSRC